MPVPSVVALLLLSACALFPPYEYEPGFDPAGDSPTDEDGGFLPGPDPWVPGMNRLSVGLFYEGGASEVVPLSDTAHFWHYDGSFSRAREPDRVEGWFSDRLSPVPNPWWGGGIHWDRPLDLSAYDTLHVSLRADSPVFDDLHVNTSGGGVEVRLPAASYGFVPDGAWHHLAIPLDDYAALGADRTRVEVPFMLIGETDASGFGLLVDALYYDQQD